MRTPLFIFSLWCFVTVATTPFSSADDEWFTHGIVIDRDGVATVNARVTLPVSTHDDLRGVDRLPALAGDVSEKTRDSKHPSYRQSDPDHHARPRRLSADHP